MEVHEVLKQFNPTCVWECTPTPDDCLQASYTFDFSLTSLFVIRDRAYICLFVV